MPLYNPPSIPGLAVDSGNVVINENSADQDFRIESDDNTHMLFVDAGNNRVGIGTSTPISSVDIEDGLTTVGAVLTLSTKETTVVDADVIGRINFRAPLETGADALLLLASIHAEADEAFDADQNNTELVFSTASGAAAAERMRLTHDGLLGIGTATPDAPLHISDATTGDLVIFESTAESSSTADDAPQLVLRSGSSTDGDYIGSIAMSGKTDSGAYANYAKIFGRIDDNANAAKSGGLFAQVMHHNALKTMLWIEGHPSGTGNMTFNYNDQAFDLNFFVKDQQMQVFQTSTIKTMGSTLRLYQKSGAGATDNDGSGAALDYYLRHSGGSDVHAGRIGVAWEGDTTGTASTQDAFMAFSTALNGTDAERMRITSAGNVGIGTAVPDTELHISSASNPTITIQQTSETGTLKLKGLQDSQSQIIAENESASEGCLFDFDSKAVNGQSQEIRLFRNSNAASDGYFSIKQPGVNTNVLLVYSDKDGTAHEMQFATGKVSIGHSSPVATLDVQGSTRFRASVEVCTSDPAPASIETGTVYQFTKGSAGTFTLPANPPVGTQFVLVNGDGQDIVITRPASGVKINGATANKTNTTAYAATSIVAVVTGTNAEWLAFGGI